MRCWANSEVDKIFKLIFEGCNEYEIFLTSVEQLKKDREDSERRIMEIANTSQETLKQEYERRKQEKIEDERKAKGQARALALEKEKVDAENAEKRKEKEARAKEAEEAEAKANKKFQEKEEALRQENQRLRRKSLS